MRTLSIVGGLSGPPAACSSAADRLDVFATGPGNMVWRWWLDHGELSGPAPLPVTNNVPGEGLCAVSSGPGRVEVFAAGAGLNTPLWWRGDAGAWSAGQILPPGANLLPVAIAAVATGPDDLDVFAAGAGNTPHWWHWNGNAWTAPLPLPAVANLRPVRVAAVSPRPGRLDVFAAGAGNHLWHWWRDLSVAPVWQAEDLGGSLPEEGVSAVSWGRDRIDVFAAARLPGGRNPLQHWWWTGTGGFAGPEDLGGNLAAGAVAAISSGPGRLDVVGVGGDRRLARWRWDGAHWSGPTHHGGGVAAGDVAAVVRAADRIDVFARGDDGSLRQWPGRRVDNLTTQPWTNLAMNWQVPSVANGSPIAPSLPLGPLAAHCRPESRAELIDIVHEAERQGRRVRAVGSSWSNSDVAVTPDFLVETHDLAAELTAVLDGDALIVPRGNLVHVEAGVTVGDLVARLDARGLALPVLGGSSGQTLAGVISTSVHGASFRLGPIPDCVRAIHLIGPGGVERWIEPTVGITRRDRLAVALGIDEACVHHDDDWFDAALVAVGCFGIIYALVIEAVPQFDLIERCEWLTWTAVRARLARGAAGNPFDVADNRDVNVIVNPFQVADGSRPCFLITRQAAPPTQPYAGGGLPGWALQILDPVARANFETNPATIDDVVTWQTREKFPATGAGPGNRGWAHTITTSAAVPPLRGLSLELAFDATTDAYLDFVDAATALLHAAYRDEGLGLAGWFSLRFVGRSRALLSPQHRHARTCMIEVAALQELSHTRPLLARLEALGRLHGGVQHWGMFDDLTEADVRRGYPDLDTWLAVRAQLTGHGTLRTFDNGFSERCGLARPSPLPPVVPPRRASAIALVRQTPGWGSIPVASGNPDGTWSVRNDAAPELIADWAHQPGVRVIAGNFGGDGKADLALVRQTPGWSSIPVATAVATGGWTISNGAAPQFIADWAHQPGVTVVAGDFGGNGRTSLALVRQSPGWASIPLAFANGDGTWTVTNGAAPQFITDWAHQPGVTVVAGDFAGNGRTSLALVRQRPGWASIPVAFANGDGTWTITNGPAPGFATEWAHQPGVTVIVGNFTAGGRAGVALVRQTPGWGSIPIATARDDGSWAITNGAAPQFADWAHQPGVRVIAGDFNGNGLTDLALVRQSPGWGSVPIAFANGDGTWTVTNGPAPQFVDWAHQPGVRVVAGDFDGNGRTDLALVRQTPGWSSIPVASANGDGTWTIRNAPAPELATDWAHQPGVRVVAVGGP